ncbi:MAG: tellurium resistance TerZ family protein [Chromatiaceae bacterium]|nr:tellurium resistance TerZ family protein [Chromatiaceae bacterium]
MAISLQKGQKISLEKEAGSPLRRVVMGLGWDTASSGKPSGLLRGLFGGGGGGGGGEGIDLDASCLLFDAAGNMVDAVWFQQLRSKDGSIQHTGDNRSGQGEGDDEQILVDLERVPATVSYLVFAVNSFSGQSFDQVQRAFCRLIDGANQREIARYDLGCQGPHTAMVMAKLYRHNQEWKMHAIGESARGQTVRDLLPVIGQYL